MMSPGALQLYWHTLRHLKPAQWYGRAWFRLHRPRPDLRPAPPLRQPSGQWVAPAQRAPSQLGPTRFRFLNETQECAVARDWNDPAREKLWLYNLHYFDDLNAEGAASRRGWHRTLMGRWVVENPPAHGNGWEPYPTSLRCVNWVKGALAGLPLDEGMRRSLAVQARWLRRRLEIHLLGNHLFANAKALVFCGLFFTGDEAEAWLRCGLRILRRELAEQVLADGGHFERSPMYHALMLEDVLDTVNVIRTLAPPGSSATALAPTLEATVPPMLQWLAAMTHPDASFGAFNDSAQGIAPDLAQLQAYASRLCLPVPLGPQPPLVHLESSGYVRAIVGPAVALLDVAPIGPDYLPGHAHADTLSFELSLAGRRIVVNGGTSCYGNGPQRQSERATASHSTVEVAGQNSSQVWSGFRVGRRAYPSPVEASQAPGTVVVTCSHDGYTFLPGQPRHRRTWALDATGMTVTDAVSNAALTATARYILAPGLSLTPAGPRAWTVAGGAQALAHVDVVCGDSRVVAAHHAPRFGAVEATHCLAVALVDGRAATRWTWIANAHPVSD